MVETEAASDLLRFSAQAGTIVLRPVGEISSYLLKLLGKLIARGFEELKTQGGSKTLRMMKKGATMLTLSDKDMETFTDHAKMMGLDFVVVKDNDLNDGKQTVMVLNEQAPAVNHIIERYGLGVLDKAAFDVAEVPPERETAGQSGEQVPRDRDDGEKGNSQLDLAREFLGKENEQPEQPVAANPTIADGAERTSEPRSSGSSNRQGNDSSESRSGGREVREIVRDKEVPLSDKLDAVGAERAADKAAEDARNAARDVKEIFTEKESR